MTAEELSATEDLDRSVRRVSGSMHPWPMQIAWYKSINDALLGVTS
jgi:hypothetical protein